ncbi:2-dehydropantoate 2-reductase [Bowmanella sp. Y26]|uniref:ketopantoate reductase family protein n=1 Tax=Bowmanella yangjiangensis TaxID=2811230 RepID=UPI001BDC9CC7|nr:2-dehydropantoate 2-reductase [Bowmanella yangjiangensis]MBT1062958.1 2-dehydropantoate 2-reductase [Bowmanella yangjiangensis]
MNIVIVGQGAIGSALAARCEIQGLAYKVMGRTSTLQCIEWIAYQGERLAFLPESIEPLELKGNELIILPLKAYQILPAVTALKPYLTEQTLLLLHNGMGTQSEIEALLPGLPLALGITRMAVLKQGTQVTETGLGGSDLGWALAPANTANREQAEHLLSSILVPCQWHAQIAPLQWAKLAVNAVINPLTALHNISNGELAQPQYQASIQALNEEIATLMQALNIPGAQDIPSRLAQVINATAANYSSMHQDVIHGRPTEIDYINGYLLKEAERLGLALPHHLALWQKIHARQA